MNQNENEDTFTFQYQGNEVIAWCSFGVGLCFLLSCHPCYMCCCGWCSLHHICVSWVNNNNIHQNVKAIFNDKNIHLSINEAKEKVGDLPLNMCSILQNNNCNSILKCVMGYYTFTLQGHWNKWVLISSMVWPHWHHERWPTIGCGKPRWVCSAIRKQANDKCNAFLTIHRNRGSTHINQLDLWCGRTSLGLAHERRHACTISEETPTKSKVNSCLCKQSIKKIYNEG